VNIMSQKFYAGIGSRETPDAVIQLMRRVGAALRVQGWTLRSGNALGADSAFQYGAYDVAQIFLPWASYNNDPSIIADDAEVYDTQLPRAFKLAEAAHPAWDRCRQGARKLHARNAHIVLGPSLDEPVDFVLCWTKDGGATGGTGLGIRLAESRGIPVFNLHDESVRLRLETMCERVELAKEVASCP
jgi:hypothetical protein